jgi:hypothetical protein
MLLNSGKRPRDLAICVVAALLVLFGSNHLYAYLGQKFTRWVVHDKLSEIQKQKPFDFDSRPGVHTNFSNFDLTNANWTGTGFARTDGR